MGMDFRVHMSYSILSLMAVTIFCTIHLLAVKTQALDFYVHGRFLSAGGGIAIAYVFIDLLPKLSASDAIVSENLAGVFPYFQRHVYIMALAGFLLFFIVDRASQNPQSKKRAFYLSLGSYALFNFLVGYGIADPYNPEVKPLTLFTFAMGLHYFTNDYSLNASYGDLYNHEGKWVLMLCLYLGWWMGQSYILSKTAIALVSAFIGGGVIMNVIRHELPKNNPNNLSAFICSTIFYTAILLAF